MSILNMRDVELAGQRVLIREDLNVPIENGRITSDTRLRAAVPTLRSALDAGAAVMVMSHLGRPAEGEYDEAASLAPVRCGAGAVAGSRRAVDRGLAGWRAGSTG